MNLELLDPWEQEYPQVIGETLEDGDILNCKFNRRGTLLAAGCQDGRFIIWDMDTKGIARDVEAHSKSVTNVSWSRNGRYLLTVSKDWTCVLWDLLTADVYGRARFDAPPLMAHMHPKKNFIFVAALMQSAPYVVDLSSERARITRLSLDSLEGEENSSRPFSVSAVAWNKTGKRIYAGTTKGYLYIFDSSTFKVVYSTRVTTTTIKEIQWGRNGKDILFNSNDRVIRLYQVDDYDGIPVLKNKFQDLVNRIQWNTTCISADGEFVVGGSGHKAEHNIYIWDKEKSNLVKILEGPKDSLDDLAWHPVRPIIASVSSYGNIYMWTIKNEANWSAFAPDFTELEENLEYEEKEDEFDVVPEEEVSKRKQDDEDIEVDVTTCEDVQAFVDSDDDGDTPEEERKEIFYLPPLPFGDGVTKAPTKRRRSLDMVVNSIKKRAPRA